MAETPSPIPPITPSPQDSDLSESVSDETKNTVESDTLATDQNSPNNTNFAQNGPTSCKKAPKFDKHGNEIKKESFWQTLKSLAILITVLCAIRSVIIDWNDVPTGSMNPTILEGDRIVVNHLAYNLRVPFLHWEIVQWSKPQRGEIVTFKSPLDGNRNVKRIVGVPGDKFTVRNGRIYINGKSFEYIALPSDELSKEFYTEKGVGPDHTIQFEHQNTVNAKEQIAAFNAWKAGEFMPPAGFKQAYPLNGPGPEDLSNFIFKDNEGVIPEGHYFMMGDNRTNSKDSRARGYGPVPMENIYGRAFGVAANFNFSEWEFKWERYFTSLE